MFEVDSPNTITISALESKEAIISVGNTILDSKLFTWKQFETGDKTGFGIEFNAVPEPSEWALIFGTLALGFVIYRRRK